MSIDKSKDKSKKKRFATGAVLVALSGFVPQPSMQRAFADTATIKASGEFSDGIVMSAGAKLLFGKMVATAVTGSISQTTGAVQAFSNGFQNAGTVQAGSYAFSAALGAKVVDFTIKGVGDVTGTGTITGATALRLTKVFLGGPWKTVETLSSATLTPTKTTAKGSATLVGGTPVLTNIAVGGVISWVGGVPIGTFKQDLTLIIAY